MDSKLVTIYKYFHNLNDYQITNKSIVYVLMSMFYLQQICHALNDFSTYLVEGFENKILNVINHSILLFQVVQPSNIIPIEFLIYIFFTLLLFYILMNLMILYNFKDNPNSFDTLKSLISLFDFVNYFFLGDVILNNSLKSLVCNDNGYSDFLIQSCSGTQYSIIVIISIMNIGMEILILLKYCYFCNTILMNNSFPLCRNVCKIEICVSTTKVINIVLRLIKNDDITTKIIVTCFNTCLYGGISIYVLVYLPFHKRMSNYMVFYYNSLVFFFYLFIVIFVLSGLKSMMIFLIVLLFVNHILSKSVFEYRVNSLIFKKNVSSVDKYYEIIFISNYFLELYENEFDHYSKCLKFGIISRHLNECINENCPLKNKEKLYFPIKQEWSSEEKSVYENTTFVFLIICILENFNKNYPNKFINIYLSELFLIFVGNQNKTLYYIYNFKNMKVGKLEMFHFVKLSEDIENVLRKKLKDSRESKGFSMEEIDIMQFFQINSLFESLKKYIQNYLRNSDKFWKMVAESSIMILSLDKLYLIGNIFFK